MPVPRTLNIAASQIPFASITESITLSFESPVIFCAPGKGVRVRDALSAKFPASGDRRHNPFSGPHTEDSQAAEHQRPACRFGNRRDRREEAVGLIAYAGN